MMLSRRAPRSLFLAFALAAASLGAPASAEEAEAPKVAGTDVPPPKRTKFVMPVYPAEAQEKGLHGIVILELRIDKEGAVAEVRVLRSIPPFDDVAIAAAKQWEYEPTLVAGKPVSVLQTVPITFALRLPELSRQEGVPELRAGASAQYPRGASGVGRVVLGVTLDPTGHIAEIDLVSGENPFQEALLQAVRTWRFASPEPGLRLSFRIEADFEAARRGVPEKVAVRLTGLQTVSTAGAPSPAPAELSQGPSPEPTPGSGMEPAPPAPSSPPPAPAPAPPPTPQPTAAPSAPSTPPQAAPGTEVLTAPLPPQPAAPAPVAGSSSVENVTLGVGVPDLAQGRRPVVPPFARIAGVSGSVEVRFAVNAGGQSSVLETTGTELLKAAAQGAVASWTFRRSTAERLFLTAVFSYRGDAASANVSPTPLTTPGS